MRRRILVGAGVGLTAVLARIRPAHAAELTVQCSNGLRAVLEEMQPGFEGATGDRLNVTYGAAAVLKQRIDAGAAFDVAILTPPLIADLVRAGRVAADLTRTIARAGLGIAIRAGAPRPDIGSLEAFRRTLLNAQSIIYSAAGASGVAFLQAIDRMGIGAEVRARARANDSGANAAIVVRGEAEIAVQLIPELLAVPGAEVVGPFPVEVQSYVVLAGGIADTSAQGPRARALLAYLTTPEALGVIRAKGMEPG